MAVLLIPDGLEGLRIDVAVSRMTGISRSRIADLIQKGMVELGGLLVERPSIKVHAGQILEVDISEPVRTPKVVPLLADGLRIVHEDSDLIVVDKPAGVAAHPSLGWEGPDVLSHLAAAGIQVSTSGAAERQGIVQRLDAGTSGLMMVAKSEYAYSVLKQAFRDRAVDKTYLTLAQGHPDPFSGTIDAPIARHPSHDWKFAVVAPGRHSVTHYETVEVLRSAALLKVHLETGRTHQIRVHLSAIGHPCIGDPLYGADPVLAARLGLERQWLHAIKLGFVHPGTSEYVSFESEPSTDLYHALEMLRSDW